jgi:hypothetical protein
MKTKMTDSVYATACQFDAHARQLGAAQKRTYYAHHWDATRRAFSVHYLDQNGQELAYRIVNLSTRLHVFSVPRQWSPAMANHFGYETESLNECSSND